MPGLLSTPSPFLGRGLLDEGSQPQGILSWDDVAALAKFNADQEIAKRRAAQAALGKGVTDAAAGAVRGVGNAVAGLGAYPHDVMAGTATGDPVQWATNMATGMMGGGSAFPAAANDLRMGIKAYHGSPHDFDKFDISKIGTGEGAQAYGHGLYFAENPEVANVYKNNLAAGSIEFGGKRVMPGELSQQIWQDSGNQSSDFLKGVMDAVHELTTTGKRPVPPADLNSWMGYGSMDQRQGYAFAAGKLADAKAAAGKTYEVSINAHPDEFLDWDKPLSQQPQAVQDVLASAPRLQDPHVAGKITAGEAYGELSGVMGGRDKAAEALRAAGIKGIRYADQGSRNVFVEQRPDGKFAVHGGNFGPGQSVKTFDTSEEAHRVASEQTTNNYVVFDDKTVEILKKYGLAGLTALGAGAGYAANQPLQSTTGQTIPKGTPIY